MPPSLVERLDAIEDLPTIPHTMQAVLSSLDSVSASAEKLENIIKEDPVLTAKVLKIANSAAYGAGAEISSLSRAIVTIGFEEVRNIVIGLSLSGIFCDDIGFDEFDAVDIWLHSIGVATCAKMIAQETDGLDPEEMFTVGMLHDIGRILFCLYFPDELRDILGAVENDGMSLTEATKSTYFLNFSPGLATMSAMTGTPVACHSLSAAFSNSSAFASLNPFLRLPLSNNLSLS